MSLTIKRSDVSNFFGCRRITEVTLDVLMGTGCPSSNCVSKMFIPQGRTSLDKPSAKQRSYVCPPNFIRLSHKCYFFSKEKLTFHDAFFKCRSLHSNLAIIKNSNQDKHIKKTLSSRTVEPLERWLGGRFDWQKKQWQWAASGKPLTYNGFDSSFNQTQESLQWQCITIDPAFQYRWNSRSCYQERNYICQKKLRTIDNNKSRKRLLEQYE
ncbi:hypothetical protein D910_02903, partial [Dendroctonus ponderosae]